VAEAEDWDSDTTATDLQSLSDTPNPSRTRACLTVITGAAAGQTLKLQKGDLVIGR
jgi:hypothetical protein